MYNKPAKSKRIIMFNYRAMRGPMMDQGGTLTLWGSCVPWYVFLLFKIKINFRFLFISESITNINTITYTKILTITIILCITRRDIGPYTFVYLRYVDWIKSQQKTYQGSSPQKQEFAYQGMQYKQENTIQIKMTVTENIKPWFTQLCFSDFVFILNTIQGQGGVTSHPSDPTQALKICFYL